MANHTLRGKHILVTGGGGFLGKHVMKRLREAGALVVAPSSHEADLREQTEVRRVLAAMKPNLVVHLAARGGGIGFMRDHPGQAFYDNATMSTILMHESYRAGVEKLVAAGTVCSYPKHAPIPFGEDALWNGYPEETNAPYGLAKRMTIAQSQAYRKEYGFNSAVLLLANLYGPGDNFDLETSHAIPAIIRKCVEAAREGKEEMALWGDGSPTREFLYVEDAAEGIVAALEKYDDSEPVNLGTGLEVSIRDLAGKIAALTRFGGRIVWDTSRPNGQPRRMLDTSRAREGFGWAAKMPLEEGLRRTVEWYVGRAAAEARKT